MHFSKTYIQLLEDLPPELQVNVIQYRQVCLAQSCFVVVRVQTVGHM